MVPGAGVEPAWMQASEGFPRLYPTLRNSWRGPVMNSLEYGVDGISPLRLPRHLNHKLNLSITLVPGAGVEPAWMQASEGF